MSVENASEVTAKYSINYTIDNTKNIPLEFSLTGTDGWTNDITTLSATDVIKTNSRYKNFMKKIGNGKNIEEDLLD